MLQLSINTILETTESKRLEGFFSNNGDATGENTEDI